MTLRIGVFSSKSYDREYFTEANRQFNYQLSFLEARLTPQTSSLLEGFDVICVFVNDLLNRDVLEAIRKANIQHVALRCAGFNNLDQEAAKFLNIRVSRVPAYSPQAVAEHTFALIQTLNRHTHKAYNRVKENNFNLEGLTGFNLHKKTLGIVGTGNIGSVVAKIALGYGCEVLCFDPSPSAELLAAGCQYGSLDSLLTQSDILTLHCPLTQDNQHLIDDTAIGKARDGFMLVNTSRGGLIDTKAVIKGLKSKKIGYLALDVYEMESDLFFTDRSTDIVQDDLFARLSTFPNVLITGHQGFFTHEALQEIAMTTLSNISALENGEPEIEHFAVL